MTDHALTPGGEEEGGKKPGKFAQLQINIIHIYISHPQSFKSET